MTQFTICVCSQPADLELPRNGSARTATDEGMCAGDVCCHVLDSVNITSTDVK